MNNSAYRLAVNSAVISHVLRVTAGMTRFYRQRASITKIDQTQRLMARIQALRRMNAGLGLAHLPLAVGRGAPHRQERAPRAGYGTGSLAPRRAAMAARFPATVRHALLASGIMPASMRRQLPGALTVRPTRIRSGRVGFGGSGRTFGALARGKIRLPGGLSRRNRGAALISITAAQPRLEVPIAPRLAARIAGLGKAPSHAASIAMAGIVAGRAHRIAAPPLPQAVAPGFHHTVRQPQGKAAAGDVYLDKALVGYHLAAAITVEQTRAAARPNTSAARFNSGMAALRPAGAGL
jgi:hypothetical protein